MRSSCSAVQSRSNTSGHHQNQDAVDAQSVQLPRPLSRGLHSPRRLNTARDSAGSFPLLTAFPLPLNPDRWHSRLGDHRPARRPGSATASPGVPGAALLVASAISSEMPSASNMSAGATVSPVAT